jgi:hypothetical protein
MNDSKSMLDRLKQTIDGLPQHPESPIGLAGSVKTINALQQIFQVVTSDRKTIFPATLEFYRLAHPSRFGLGDESVLPIMTQADFYAITKIDEIPELLFNGHPNAVNALYAAFKKEYEDSLAGKPLPIVGSNEDDSSARSWGLM